MKSLAFALIESPRVSERLHPSARQSSDTEASRCAIAAWASCTWAFDSANFLPPSRPRSVGSQYRAESLPGRAPFAASRASPPAPHPRVR